MKFRPFIVILPLLWWGTCVKAQVPEEPSSSSSMPEQWQLTLDVIKSKAQNLMVENSGLQTEYQKLTGQVQEVQQEIDSQQSKNEQKNRSLQERHGQTDQQLRIEALTQGIKAKTQQVRAYEAQLADLKRKQSDANHKVQLIKYAIRGAELHGQPEDQEAQASQDTAALPVDDQLTQLRKQLEDESTQEVLLENEWSALKSGDQTRIMKADAYLPQADTPGYEQRKKRKEELESTISMYELRMDELRQSSLTVLSWPTKKKSLVHEMVLIDARNDKMRGITKELREDIDVLKDQVAKLERRVDFAKGQGTQQ